MSENPKYSRYLRWAEDNLGVQVHAKLELVDLPPPHERGYVAAEAIPEKKHLLSIPRPAFMVFHDIARMKVCAVKLTQ